MSEGGYLVHPSVAKSLLEFINSGKPRVYAKPITLGWFCFNCNHINSSEAEPCHYCGKNQYDVPFRLAGNAERKNT